MKKITLTAIAVITITSFSSLSGTAHIKYARPAADKIAAPFKKDISSAD